MHAAGTGITVATICETTPGPDLEGRNGRLTRTVLRRLVPDLQDREIFVCGLLGYMASVREPPRRGGGGSRAVPRGELRARLGTDPRLAPVGTGPQRRGRLRGGAAAQRADAGPAATDTFVLDAAVPTPVSLCRPPAGRACAAPARARCSTGSGRHAARRRHPTSRDRGRQQILLCCPSRWRTSSSTPDPRGTGHDTHDDAPHTQRSDRGSAPRVRATTGWLPRPCWRRSVPSATVPQ